jgi:hypothetical protein
LRSKSTVIESGNTSGSTLAAPKLAITTWPSRTSPLHHLIVHLHQTACQARGEPGRRPPGSASALDTRGRAPTLVGMVWAFETEPEFQRKLDWAEELVRREGDARAMAIVLWWFGAG